jgi:hypothetical protein
LNRADIRLVALETGGPERIPSVPRFDKETKTALVDSVDPARMGSALGSLRGQTMLVSGRVEDGALTYAGGKVPIADLEAAAATHDVNLVILDTPSPRQPGGRNWLWQKVQVKGLNEAMSRATFADFLSELGASRGGLAINAGERSGARVRLSATPIESTATTVTAPVNNWLDQVLVETLGRAPIHAVHINTRTEERQKELDSRIVPWIPAVWQWGYIFLLVAGLIGLGPAGRWFSRFWRPERREDYAGWLGYRLAVGLRLAVLALLFVPLVAPLALPLAILEGLVEQLRGLWHGLRRLVGAG